MAGAQGVDSAVQGACLGRVVSFLTCLCMVVFLGLFGLLMYALYASGIGKRLAGVADNLLVVLFIAGFLFAIIAAGLIGNRLRRFLWSILLRRR